MKNNRTKSSRRKSKNAKAYLASAQGDLFQAAEQSTQDPPPHPPSQALRALELAIQMKAGDTLETVPNGRMKIISATNKEKDSLEEPNEIKIRLSILNYLQNTRALTREICNSVIHLLDSSFEMM